MKGALSRSQQRKPCQKCYSTEAPGSKSQEKGSKRNMIEVYPGLFVSHRGDCPLHGAQLAGSWAIVHAYPACHRKALGYATMLAPDGPEYYLARQGHDLLLNMTDAEQPGHYRKEAQIDPALAFIDEMRAEGASILIHCEQGM